MVIFIIQALDHGWLKSFALMPPRNRKTRLTGSCSSFITATTSLCIFQFSDHRLRGDPHGGRRPTLADGLQAAVNRFPILPVALIAATVGFFLAWSNRAPSGEARRCHAWDILVGDHYLAIP